MSLDRGRRNLPCLGHVQGRKAAKIALNMAMGSFDSTVTQGDLKMVFTISLNPLQLSSIWCRSFRNLLLTPPEPLQHGDSLRDHAPLPPYDLVTPLSALLSLKAEDLSQPGKSYGLSNPNDSWLRPDTDLRTRKE
jgi:hypothetical protein